MSRIRILVSETAITKAEQVNFFQIKLSKHAIKIVGIETDVVVKSKFGQGDVITEPHRDGDLAIPPKLEEAVLIPKITDSAAVPFLPTINYNVAGKLSLQSMEKENIFFSDWVKASVFYEGFIKPTSFQVRAGLKDIRGKTAPKKVDVPVESTIINALYRDNIGKQLKQDISYTLKVFVWLEVKEAQNGVDFEFMNQEELIKR